MSSWRLPEKKSFQISTLVTDLWPNFGSFLLSMMMIASPPTSQYWKERKKNTRGGAGGGDDDVDTERHKISP